MGVNLHLNTWWPSLSTLELLVLNDINLYRSHQRRATVKVKNEEDPPGPPRLGAMDCSSSEIGSSHVIHFAPQDIYVAIFR